MKYLKRFNQSWNKDSKVLLKEDIDLSIIKDFKLN